MRNFCAALLILGITNTCGLLVGCASSPSVLEKPLTVEGIVLHTESGEAVAGAIVEVSWYGFGFPKGRRKVLAETVSDSAGRFHTAVSEGPVTEVVSWIPNNRFAGRTTVEREGELHNVVVEVSPSISIRSNGRDGNYDELIRYRDIVKRILSVQVPGSQTSIGSLQSHLDAGRISEDDVRFLLENRARFTGPWGDGPPEVLEGRILWGNRELAYGAPTDEIWMVADE